MAEHCYAEYHLCFVTNQPFMHSIVMQNAIMLRVIMLSVMAPPSGSLVSKVTDEIPQKFNYKLRVQTFFIHCIKFTLISEAGILIKIETKKEQKSIRLFSSLVSPSKPTQAHYIKLLQFTTVEIGACTTNKLR
jgi:hypothetical protein